MMEKMADKIEGEADKESLGGKLGPFFKKVLLDDLTSS